MVYLQVLVSSPSITSPNRIEPEQEAWPTGGKRAAEPHFLVRSSGGTQPLRKSVYLEGGVFRPYILRETLGFRVQGGPTSVCSR